ncbi:unnamed protein product, partial [Symbiodinium sp. KB8]
MRLTQLQAAEPDTTLLVKGLDTLTQKALAKHPSSLFRLATFRERLGIDYAPTSEAVSELCHMLQAEVEHLSHSGADEGPQKEDADNKRQKLQKVLSPAAPKPSSPVHPSAKASGAKPCKNWLTAGGCSYGNSCQFFHDQSEEKMKGRCFSCSAEDHWADTCPVKQEIDSSIPVTVSLAVGEMVMFRNDSDLLVRPRLLCPPPFARVWQHALGKDDVSLGSLREWLSKHLRDDSCGELELQTVSKVLFPDLPEALASQVATSPSFDPSRVPFNRRTRRQLFDPQVPTMVHLFAGQHRWRNSVGQVLEVDAAKGADLLSDDVFGMLLRAATSGAIDGVVVAPPCKTFDPDASAPSSGGMTFRGEEGEERFGHQGLSHADQALVDRDTLLFLRSLLLIFVAACAKEKVFTCLEMPEASYAWEWPECENVTVSLGGWTAGFDQGALGSANHKSSAVYTSSFQLYEALHEVRVAPENGDSRTSDFSDKGWAPGLVSRILRAWENYCYLSFEKIQALTREREGLLLNLCQEAVAAKMSPEVWERQAFAMQLAVMRAVAHLRAHGIPCFRFHSDRAREFLGDALERFLAEQGIFSTRTAPEDHAANGASEVAIRELKRAARKALLASNLDSSHWPTAIRHVGEVAWRRGTEKAEAQGCVDLSYKDDTMCITSAVYPVDYHPPPSSSESLESEAESLDFLQDPQQESLSFQEARRRQATLYVSFGYFEPEQWRALCTLEEEEFERLFFFASLRLVMSKMPSQGSGNASTAATLSTEQSTIVEWRIAGLQGCQQVVDNDDDFEKTLHYAIRGYAVAANAILFECWVDHNDRADVNAPVARWERHYAVLTDEEVVIGIYIRKFGLFGTIGLNTARDPGAGSAFRMARLSLSQSGSGNPVTSCQVLKAITMYVKQKDAVNRISKRPIAGSYRESTSEAALPPWFWSSGAWVFSGKVGVTKTVATCPWFTRLLVTALSRQTPQSFATIAFLVNIEMEVHKDSHNDASSMNLAWNVGQGGGSLEVSGHRIALPPGAWVSFPPREFHKSGPWDGNKVLVLGYTPRSLEKLTSSELLSLRWVGMPFDHSLPSDSPLLAAIDCESGDEEMILPSEMSWDQVGQDFEHMHHCVTFFLKTLQRSVVGSSSEGPVDPITLQAMREAAALRKELEWHLELARLQGCEVPVSSSVWRVCAAAPAAEHLESQPILHTRIVSNEEVREKLHEWRDAMKAECDSLISKGAVELVADGQVDQWIAEGKDVEILPGRGVATEKPPTSPGATKRNKYRAVICGNFQKWSEERASESFYAGGSGTDIKTAFLNAPLDEGEAEKRDRTCRTLTWFTGECSRHLQQCVSDPNIWLVKSSQDEILALVCWMAQLTTKRPKDALGIGLSWRPPFMLLLMRLLDPAQGVLTK